MDFQSHYQDPLNSMNYQFQNISLQNGPTFDPAIARMGTPVRVSSGAAQPLSRQTSIMDSIGIQRSSSPFVDPSSGLNSASTPSAAAAVAAASATPTTSSATTVPTTTMNPALTPGHMFNSLSHQNSVAQDSATSSPYPSQMATPNVLHGGLFGSVPPGVSSSATGRAPPLLVDSQWRYIDTQGQIQGPFGSGPMSQWYASGYFQPSLQISRVPTTLEPFGINDNFITLGDLISKVNNFQDPFHAFDLVAANILPNIGSALNVPVPPAPAAADAVAAAPTSTTIAPVTASANVPFQQQQHPASTTALPSEDYTHDEILKLKDLDGGYYHDTVVPIPTGSRKQEKVTEQERLEKVAEKKSEEGTKKDEKKKKKEEEESKKQKAEEAARQLLEQEYETKRKEESKKSKKSQKQKEVIRESPPVEPSTKEISPKEQTAKPATVQPATEVKTTVAPWADKVKNTALPKLPSISELQKREEMERVEKQRQEKIAADKLKEQIIKEDKERQELKSVLTWADKPKAAPVSVDIKPQLKKEEKKKPSRKQETVTLDEFNDPKFLKEQTKLWEEAQKSKTKRPTVANTASIVSSAGGQSAWTTVTSKSVKQTSVGAQQKPTVQPKSYINPDKLRAVGSNNTTNRQIGSSTSIPGLKVKQTQSTPAYPGNASISARQEFLRWCRSRMQLNASVRKDAVLEVLLSLPAGGESVSIIADTINSNSNAMDGKRFAEEFIKRRQEVEKQIKDPLTWAEVLSMPEGDDDDWEFQVVSKKKGRKH
ncbi:ZYRO0F15004p [Zygosaccharomyces rouxii]|uniref:ZYRO0F15004p n=1 Tax=Zygosaccharomyces rouxii (strain ATCC 2623 / CBS 732 / NBRC 1130 / NCYC 568 / NRRL Y-229) TaxID=559307 RepID=C5DYQ9_ZYGRC|nr:uncharacterized protein ZYRO0F15004g [Zygosaccharomyces rouxii]KAH9199676.1 hypothetical protein LQ764DRAFT_235376 [Zygosaccharomyces rouxii]CAR28920.1 ZYRO0F15004p [Zygosaccharomyces rouxii]